MVKSVLKSDGGNFPVGPVVKTLYFQCRGLEFDLEPNIPHGTWHSQKILKPDCNERLLNYISVLKFKDGRKIISQWRPPFLKRIL